MEYPGATSTEGQTFRQGSNTAQSNGQSVTEKSNALALPGIEFFVIVIGECLK